MKDIFSITYLYLSFKQPCKAFGDFNGETIWINRKKERLVGKNPYFFKKHK